MTCPNCHVLEEEVAKLRREKAELEQQAAELKDRIGRKRRRQRGRNPEYVDGFMVCPFASIPGETPCDNHTYSGCSGVY